MNRIVFWLFLMFLISCESEDISFYNSSIQNVKEKIAQDGAILVIPGAGCSGCISGVEYFVNNNYYNYWGVTYVFTNIMSRKLLRLKISEIDIDSCSRILVDKDNLFYDIKNENKIYPCLLFLNGYEVDSIFYLSPTSNVSIEELLFKYKNKN